MKKYIPDLKIFTFLFILCGILCCNITKFPDVDYLNYGVYNSFAFLNNRIGFDFMPASYRTYFNPYLDTLITLLRLKLDFHPYIYFFITSLNPALLLFLTYKISKKILPQYEKISLFFISLITLSYSFFSYEMYRAINPTRKDLFIANLILLAFYILIRNLFENNSKRLLKIGIAGGVCGLGITLKLSAFIYPLSFLLIFLFLFKKISNPFKTFFIFLISCILGFLITDGYWLYRIYSQFGNPLFPYFNNIFKSPFADYNSVWGFDFAHIKANNFFEFIFYPFIPNKGIEGLTYTPRYAVNLFCIFTFFICYKFFSFNKQYENINLIKFLFMFSFISYYLNTFFFGNYRYIIATSMLFGLILFITLNLFVKTTKKNLIVMIAIFSLITFFTKTYIVPGKINLKHEKSLIHNINPIYVKDNSVIFFTTFASSVAVKVIKGNNIKYYGYIIPKNISEEIAKKTNYKNFFIFNSQYMENEISNIFKSDVPVYIVYNQEPKFWGNFKHEYFKSFEYYAGSKIILKNCSKKDFYGTRICELKKINTKE